MAETASHEVLVAALRGAHSPEAAPGAIVVAYPHVYWTSVLGNIVQAGWPASCCMDAAA